MRIEKEVIGWIIGGMGALVALLTWLRCRRQDCRSDASADASVRIDLEYIKRGVDDIRAEQRAMRDDMSRMADRLTRVEESAKSAHRRLDEYIKMHPVD